MPSISYKVIYFSYNGNKLGSACIRCGVEKKSGEVGRDYVLGGKETEELRLI